jgi:hypothetical protein
MRVRRTAVRPRSDERRERGTLRAQLVQELVEGVRDVALGPADERLPREALVRLVRDRRRPLDQLELVGSLHGPQSLDEARRRHELQAGAAQLLPARVRQVRRLERHLHAYVRDEASHERPLDLDELHAFDLAGSLRVAEVGEQQRTGVVHEQRRVRAHEAREVADVDRRRDEQRLLEQGAQAIDPVHRLVVREASASR